MTKEEFWEKWLPKTLIASEEKLLDRAKVELVENGNIDKAVSLLGGAWFKRKARNDRVFECLNVLKYADLTEEETKALKELWEMNIPLYVREGQGEKFWPKKADYPDRFDDDDEDYEQSHPSLFSKYDY